MLKKLAIVAVLVLIIVASLVGYAFFRTPEEASAPIEAVPLRLENNEAAAVDAIEEATEPVVENDTQTETLVEQPVTETEAVVETQAAITEESLPAAEVPAEQASITPTIFEIVPGESEARFLINEVLRGDPITVVGATDQVAGQLALDPADLSNTQVGVMQVNARTLTTNNDFRNRAIKNRILLTDNYEFVTFSPTNIIGLPDKAAIGELITFQVSGDLTVTDVTQQVTFDITATPVSETRIEGTASAAFLYTDFNLAIPSAPAVDAVADDVRLEIDFVAETTGEVAG